MDIKENIEEFRQLLTNTGCRLVAVSKTKTPQEILEAYEAGQRDFGENKVQELREKEPQLPEDVRWHMIGHLQTNKVKYIAPFIHLIHAVDSIKLLKEINKQAKKNNRVIDCLLQVHIAEEETKFGLSWDELYEILRSETLTGLKNIRIVGLMGMATYTDEEQQLSKEFESLKKLFEEIKASLRLPNVEFNELSMGMSNDYRLALEQGSTMIRIGSKIFGPRVYH